MGIPGTPMPAFDGTLSPDQRRELATYVVSLGPEIREVGRAETILVVGDRPQWVRGNLPPIAEGAPSNVRGLMLGLPEGLSFEYRGDDVRLLGVRAGQFVERTDWRGRGGTPLKQLGQVIWLNESGDPGSCFYRENEAGERIPQHGRLVATRGDRLVYDLSDDGGEVGPRIEERLRTIVTSEASGFLRTFLLQGDLRGPKGHYFLRAPVPKGEIIDQFETRALTSPEAGEAPATQAWRVHRDADGGLQVVTVTSDEARHVWNPGGSMFGSFGEGPPSTTVHHAVLLPGLWDVDVRARLIEELNR